MTLELITKENRKMQKKKIKNKSRKKTKRKICDIKEIQYECLNCGLKCYFNLEDYELGYVPDIIKCVNCKCNLIRKRIFNKRIYNFKEVKDFLNCYAKSDLFTNEEIIKLKRLIRV